MGRAFSRSGLKLYLRWGILVASLGFLLHTLVTHWQDVGAIRLDRGDGALLLVALGITLLAHTWSGWVWGWILQALQQPLPPSWSTVVYLQTNLWKYLPGNVWHLVGRVQRLRQGGVPPAAAVVGVLLDPLLMAVAALVVALAAPTPYWRLQLLGLGLGLGLVHPRWLNPLLTRLGRGKALPDASLDARGLNPAWLMTYPWRSLGGEIGFVGLRSLGFVVVVVTLAPLPPSALLPVISRFSLAWLMGLIVPGAPGGLGVFEAVAISLLRPYLPAAIALSAVALYRLIGTIAEVLGAALVTLDARFNPPSSPPAPPSSVE